MNTIGKRITRHAFIVFLLIALPAHPLFASEATRRVEVPIHQLVLPNGEIRYWVPVNIGNTGPVQAMLDTGSTGLRVFSNSVSPDDYHDLAIQRKYSYGSGVLLTGTMATANVTIGAADANRPIVIQVIQSVSCVEAQQHCPASRLSQEEYRIGGDGIANQGFTAIIGISPYAIPASNAAINPLSAMGSQRWIVMLPLPGSSSPGSLIINPNDDDLAGFKLTKLTGFNTGNEFPLCLKDEPDGTSCDPVLLDSGARKGLAPFYSFAILYDQKQNSIGIRPRNDTAPTL